MSDSCAKWKELMQTMDGKGGPLPKRQINRKPQLYEPKQRLNQDNDDTPGSAWASDKHGYFLMKGELVYKMPGGVISKATGVDTFGPF